MPYPRDVRPRGFDGGKFPTGVGSRRAFKVAVQSLREPASCAK